MVPWFGRPTAGRKLSSLQCHRLYLALFLVYFSKYLPEKKDSKAELEQHQQRCRRRFGRETHPLLQLFRVRQTWAMYSANPDRSYLVVFPLLATLLFCPDFRSGSDQPSLLGSGYSASTVGSIGGYLSGWLIKRAGLIQSA